MTDSTLISGRAAGCRTQRVVLPDGERTWTVLDGEHRVVGAQQFLDLGQFLGWLRTGDSPALVSIERQRARFSEGTIALRLQAVCSFYRYQDFNGI